MLRQHLSLEPVTFPIHKTYLVEQGILDSGRSYSWVVGSGEAIRGLDAAVVLMNEGEHQVWEIPPALA